MNTKRIVRWVIVLLLLAALPGITAVLAQEQEPPAKAPLPAVTEPGESAAPDYNVHESEPNNTMGQADVMGVNDVMFGEMNDDGDVDFFKFYIYERGTAILIDVDADTLGTDMDPTVTLYNAAGTEVGYDDDSSDTVDPLLYRNLAPGWWYVKVRDYYSDSGDNYYYDLIVSSPLLISAAAANLGTGTVAGIPFRAEDILAWSDLNDGEEKWVMLVDGSDVGFTKNVMSLSRGWGGSATGDAQPALVVNFAANITMTDYQGIFRTVKPWDWMQFHLDQAGSVTSISYRYMDWGSNAGLTTAAEKVDALAFDDQWATASSYYRYISTVGTAKVPKAGGGVLTVPDEDVFRLQHQVTAWYNTALFDGSRVVGLAAKDVYAMSYYAPYNDMYLTILGTGNIAGHPVTQKDIFRIDLPGHTWGSLVWHGPDHGWNYNIDAFDYPGGW